PLPHASARSASADARLDRADGSASKADNRFPVRRLMLQKNRRFPVPVFLPNMWGGRKFRSCARRYKKFLRNSDRGSPVRDTSSRWAAEVPAFSCEKAKHSQSLMHRRNSSRKFGGDAARRRPVGAARRPYHGKFLTRVVLGT